MNEIDTFTSKQIKYLILKSFLLDKKERDGGGVEISCEITLCKKNFGENTEYFKANFVNVTDLKIGNLNGTVATQISILDISSYQLEEINYKIGEDESDQFSFTCTSFSFEEIKG